MIRLGSVEGEASRTDERYLFITDLFLKIRKLNVFKSGENPNLGQTRVKIIVTRMASK